MRSSIQSFAPTARPAERHSTSTESGRDLASRHWVKFAPDSVLEEAVSSEPVSWEPKFPASRENTGNFIDSELSGASTRAKKAINSVPYEPIPYASEQGIFCGLAGN